MGKEPVVNFSPMFRQLMTFIDRVGFPILAFLLMFGILVFIVYKCVPVVQEVTATLREISTVLKQIERDLPGGRRR